MARFPSLTIQHVKILALYVLLYSHFDAFDSVNEAKGYLAVYNQYHEHNSYLTNQPAILPMNRTTVQAQEPDASAERSFSCKHYIHLPKPPFAPENAFQPFKTFRTRLLQCSAQWAVPAEGSCSHVLTNLKLVMKRMWPKGGMRSSTGT